MLKLIFAMTSNTDNCDIDMTYADDMSNISTQDNMDELETKLKKNYKTDN